MSSTKKQIFNAAAILAIALANMPRSIAQTGLEGYWTFDTANGGTTAIDSSGNNRNGTIVGAQALNPGKVNQALQFAAGNYVSVPDNTGFQLTHDLTLAVWIQTTNTTQTQNFIGKYNDTGAE